MDEILISSKQWICMDFNCFVQFRTKYSEIDKHVTDLTAKCWVDLKIFIDENVTASIMTGFDGVYLRKVYVGNYKVERVSTGIALRLQEWDTLKSCVKELLQMEPDTKNESEMNFNVYYYFLNLDRENSQNGWIYRITDLQTWDKWLWGGGW